MSFPDDEILVALMRGPAGGMTVLQLREATGRADSTIRNNIASISHSYGYGAWVQRVPGSRDVKKHIGVRYRLTQKGREVARARARRMK